MLEKKKMWAKDVIFSQSEFQEPEFPHKSSLMNLLEN